jgi:hypothetical protein
VWIDVALGEVEEAKKIIASVPKRHTFDIKYEQIEKINWESLERVLSTSFYDFIFGVAPGNPLLTS